MALFSRRIPSALRSAGGMTPPPVDEDEMRLEDYLDDKLQSTIDLENLDVLIASVEHQQTQLQSQLDDATRALENAQELTKGRQAQLESQIADFNNLQRSIDMRLRIVVESDAPDEAIRRLKKPLDRLRKVDLALGYVELLRDVEELRKEARAHLPKSPKDALRPYTRLKQLSARLKELQGPADEAAAHLVGHVAAVTDGLWDEMKQTMWAELEGILVQRNWPQVDPESVVDEEWSQSFEKLTDLQVPEVLYSPGVVTLLPVDVMAQIFAKEFRYHFMSDKPTSSPQGIGTHCFPWFLALVEKWEFFLRDNFGPILASRFVDTDASAKMVYMDPVCAFITSMLPVLREKVESAMVEAVKDPVFLSSLMGQLMTFDDNIRTTYNYDGGDPEKGWVGLTSEVLDVHFKTWLQAEKDFALERYRAIIASPDARNIDYEFAGSGKAKPTYGAVRVTGLLRSVTNQYEKLRRFGHQLRFLIDIQLEILDDYHSLLRGSLEAYQSVTSTIGRTLQGVTKEQLAALEGTGVFETLCKVHGSSDHVVNTLKEWSNEEVFVTMWERLHARAKASDATEDNLAGGMSYEEVKDRTSSAVGTKDGDGGVLFDETIAAYNQRKNRAQEFLVEALVDSHYKAFRPYAQKRDWVTISEDAAEVDPYQLAITAELDEPLRIIQRNLEFLSRALGAAVFRRIWRDAMDRLNSLLWNDVLMSHKFTTLGAAQFVRDLHAITSLIERYIRDGSSALGSLSDALRLLSLPVQDPEYTEKEKVEDVTPSLNQASEMVFTDNTEAKKLLEMLEIDSLTPAHARQILQRRVESEE